MHRSACLSCCRREAVRAVRVVRPRTVVVRWWRRRPTPCVRTSCQRIVPGARPPTRYTRVSADPIRTQQLRNRQIGELPVLLYN